MPYGHCKTVTFVAALRYDRIDAACVFDGPINDESFLVGVTHTLVSTLKPRDVMDNLNSYNGAAICKVLRAAGASLLFLPAYNFDLNPA